MDTYTNERSWNPNILNPERFARVQAVMDKRRVKECPPQLAADSLNQVATGLPRSLEDAHPVRPP